MRAVQAASAGGGGTGDTATVGVVTVGNVTVGSVTVGSVTAGSLTVGSVSRGGSAPADATHPPMYTKAHQGNLDYPAPQHRSSAENNGREPLGHGETIRASDRCLEVPFSAACYGVVSGGGQIRTHGRASTVFKTAPFDRSGTPPNGHPSPVNGVRPC